MRISCLLPFLPLLSLPFLLFMPEEQLTNLPPHCRMNEHKAQHTRHNVQQGRLRSLQQQAEQTGARVSQRIPERPSQQHATLYHITLCIHFQQHTWNTFITTMVATRPAVYPANALQQRQRQRQGLT